MTANVAMVNGMPFAVMIIGLGVSPGLIIRDGDEVILVRAAPTHFFGRPPVARIIVRVITARLIMIGIRVGHVVNRIDVSVARIRAIMLHGADGAPAGGRAVIEAGGVSRLAREAEHTEDGESRREQSLTHT